MAKFSLRRFDTQARASVVLSLASAVTLLGQIAMVLRNVDWDGMIISHGNRYRMAMMAATAITLLLAAGGFGLGFNSVGQRRNDKQSLSWLGFFVGAGVLCVTLIVFVFFWQRGELIQRG